ncbi:MAG: sigma-70 family RNA polymerase sigma factor [Anaerofustis stercorihominis]|nr:sigma-70 family RNA polymerase sigma factor [Anaerofustis stercorihominis]
MIRKIFRRIIQYFRPREKVFFVASYEYLPTPLEKKEESELIALMRNGDVSAKNKLIEHNLRLVIYISRRYDSIQMQEDLISIGTIGLIKAINTFDPDKNIKLATYASKCIENEILMYLRKTGKQRSEISLDEPLSTDWDGNELVLADIISSDELPVSSNLEKESEIIMLREAINKLSKDEQLIIALRFGIGGNRRRTQKEVADILCISQSYISRLEKKIVKTLRKEMKYC